MKAKYLVLFITAFVGLTSCDGFLDIDPTDKATEKIVWSRAEYARMAVNNFYEGIPRLGSYNNYQCPGRNDGRIDR